MDQVPVALHHVQWQDQAARFRKAVCLLGAGWGSR